MGFKLTKLSTSVDLTGILIWKELVLHRDQLKNGTLNSDGILPAAAIYFSDQPTVGDQVILTVDGDTTARTYTFVANQGAETSETDVSIETSAITAMQRLVVRMNADTGRITESVFEADDLNSINADGVVAIFLKDGDDIPATNNQCGVYANTWTTSADFQVVDFDGEAYENSTSSDAPTSFNINFGFGKRSSELVSNETHGIRNIDGLGIWNSDDDEWEIITSIGQYIGRYGISITGQYIDIDLLDSDSGLGFFGVGNDELGIDWATDFTIDNSDPLTIRASSLASTSNNEGASIIGIEDSAGYFISNNVEGALIELYDNDLWREDGSYYYKPKENGRGIKLYHTDGTNYLTIRRSGGNAAISVGGTDAQALYLNCKKQVTQLGGTSSSEFVNISDNGDGSIIQIYADHTIRIDAETTHDGNIFFENDSVYDIGERTVRPKVIWSDRFNANNDGSLSDSISILYNGKLTGNLGFANKPTGLNLIVNASAGVFPHRSYGTDVEVTNSSPGFFGNPGGAYNKFKSINTRNSGNNAPIEIIGLWGEARGRDANWDSFLESEAIGVKGYIDPTSQSAYAFGGEFEVPAGSTAQVKAAIHVINSSGNAILSKGHIEAEDDSSYNIGSSSNRFLKGFFDSLGIGDGSDLMTINSDGSISPTSATDASMPNNSIYYSTDLNYLVYKDSTGNVDNLENVPTYERYVGNTTQTIFATQTDIIFDQERAAADSTYFSSTTTEITVNKDGTYYITARVTMNGTSITRSQSGIALFLDTGGGYTEVLGTRAFGYHRNSAAGYNSPKFACTLSLNAGDKIKVQGAAIVGSATLIIAPYSSNFVIKKVK